MPTAQDYIIETLGECRYDSPLRRGSKRLFVSDDRRILLED